MFCVVCCLLFVMNRLLFDVSCVMFVVDRLSGCLLVVDRCLLVVAWRSSFVVRCLLSVD